MFNPIYFPHSLIKSIMYEPTSTDNTEGNIRYDLYYALDVKVTLKKIHGGFDSLDQHIQEYTRCIWVGPERWAQNMCRSVFPTFVSVVGTICANCSCQGLAEDANATFTSGLHLFCGATTHHMHYIHWTIDLSMQNFDRFLHKRLVLHKRRKFVLQRYK